MAAIELNYFRIPDHHAEQSKCGKLFKYQMTRPMQMLKFILSCKTGWLEQSKFWWWLFNFITMYIGKCRIVIFQSTFGWELSPSKGKGNYYLILCFGSGTQFSSSKVNKSQKYSTVIFPQSKLLKLLSFSLWLDLQKLNIIIQIFQYTALKYVE